MNVMNKKPANRPALFKAKVLEGALDFLRSQTDGKNVFAATWQRAKHSPLWTEDTATVSAAQPSH